MRVIFQGKEIELEPATDDELSLDYLTPVEDPNPNPNIEDTVELTEEEIETIHNELGDDDV